jgi:hypothetical protein
MGEILQTTSAKSNTGMGATLGSQTASVKDDYDAKLSLISRAFNEIARLCFEHDYTLTDEDWAALDAARLDDESLSYGELRSRLAKLWLMQPLAGQALTSPTNIKMPLEAGRAVMWHEGRSSQLLYK